MKDIKFIGVDNWSRPIFRNIKAKEYFGSVDKLFSYDATEKEVLEKITEKDLLYFGSFFGCEPLGTKPGEIKIIREQEPIIYHCYRCKSEFGKVTINYYYLCEYCKMDGSEIILREGECR